MVVNQRDRPTGRISAGGISVARSPWTDGGMAYTRLGQDEKRLVDLFAEAQVGVVASTVSRRKFIAARAVWAFGFTTSRLRNPDEMATALSVFPVTQRTVADIKCTLDDWQQWCDKNEDIWKSMVTRE